MKEASINKSRHARWALWVKRNNRSLDPLGMNITLLAWLASGNWTSSYQNQLFRLMP